MRSGEIITQDEMQKRIGNKPQDAKWYKEIPDGYLDELSAMNRKDRRAWMKRNKHLIKDSTK